LEARMRLQRLADRIPNPITYVNTELKYEFMNATFTEWTGVPPEKMIGKTPREARGAALGGTFESLIKRALDGEEVSMERKATLADGRVRWVRNTFAPDYGDDGKVVGCYNVSFDVHDIKLKEEALRRDAETDALTSALSRRAFFAELDRMLAACDGAAISLLFIDLDGFKAINDEFGHAAGDKLLASVVTAMRGAVDAHDLVCRLGGDEFVVVTRIASRNAVTAVTKRLIDAIEAVPASLGFKQVLSASIGVAQTISRTGSHNSDELVRQADRAMYRAKRDGGARSYFAE
jgi:diguanylate cyclase (GGDEF)-like protein/PAS domain S-box-containing protein